MMGWPSTEVFCLPQHYVHRILIKYPQGLALEIELTNSGQGAGDYRGFVGHQDKFSNLSMGTHQVGARLHALQHFSHGKLLTIEAKGHVRDIEGILLARPVTPSRLPNPRDAGFLVVHSEVSGGGERFRPADGERKRAESSRFQGCDVRFE